MGNALRVFYRKSDNQIVWTHETRSPEGVKTICPTTVEEDLSALPGKKPDGETPLGGVVADYGVVELENKIAIDAYFASDNNEISNGKISIGEPRIE